MRRTAQRGRRILLLGGLVLGIAGCAGLFHRAPPPPGDIWEAAERAEAPERRASTEMAARAENARLRGERGAARGLAEGALRIDSRNPYAYLVLARILADLGDRPGALRAASEAEARFRAEEPRNALWRERAARLHEDLERAPARASGAAPGPLDRPGRRLDPVLESGP